MRRISFYYFLFYLAMSSFQPYLSLYFSEKGLSSTAVGMILSLWALVGVIAQPVMGMLGDRLSDTRKILMISVALSPIIGLGFYYAEGYAALIVLTILFAWFNSSGGPVSDALAVEIGSREGFSFGSVRLWGALSYSLGVLAVGFIYERIGYKESFLVYLAISAVLFFVVLRFPKSKPSTHKVSLFEQAKEVVGNKGFLLFVSVCFLLTLSTAINFNFLPIYFKEMGFDKQWIGTAFSIAAIIEVPMFWLSAKLNERIGRFYMLSIAAFFYAVKCFVMFAFDNVALILAVQLFDGICYAFFAGAYVEVVDSFASERTKATFQTIFAAVTYGLGGIIGGVAGGLLIEYNGAPFLYMILFIQCLAAAVLFTVSNPYLGKKKSLSLEKTG